MATFLTKYVYGFVAGEHVILKPGDECPAWVTNPEAIRVVPDPTAPVNVTLPTISGLFEVGGTVTGTRGEWDEADSFTFRWKRDGAAISMATGESYTVQEADAGKELTFTVTAKNEVGTTDATSAGQTVAVPEEPEEPEEEEPVEEPPAEEPEEEPAMKATTTRRRTKKAPAPAEPSVQERAVALGIEIDPDWTEAEIEAEIASKE